MEIRGKTALVLGGAGLVGQAICRELINEGISKIVVSSLFEHESKAFIDQLQKEYGSKCPKLSAHWGNVFIREEYKDLSRDVLLSDANKRKVMINDLFEPLSREILTASALYKVIEEHEPHIVIDSINTATAVSYQNLFSAAKEARVIVEKSFAEKTFSEDSKAVLEKLFITQYLPQLIRHVQILTQSINEVETEIYLKIGTCGTGGMGLNIPYTHSEDKPSQMLLAKSSVAGAQSLLLFLMGRTPGGPIIKELKPAAAIAWKRIGVGPIKRKGKEILLENVGFDNAIEVGSVLSKKKSGTINYLTKDGKPKPLEAPFIDTGENGLFARSEFETITDEGQMEFITPEEIAQAAIWEIRGRNTGFDIVAALDNSTMGPTYRAGYMREKAISELDKIEESSGIDSIAFEILGPPRLAKLLYEAHLLRKLYKDFNSVLSASPEEISEKATNLLKSEPELLSRIISISIPVYLASGKLIRGETIAVPADVPGKPNTEFEVTKKSIDQWCNDGWLDLRPANFVKWKERFEAIKQNAGKLEKSETGSHDPHRFEYWKKTGNSYLIHESKLVSWIFIHEDKGIRMKG